MRMELVRFARSRRTWACIGRWCGKRWRVRFRQSANWRCGTDGGRAWPGHPAGACRTRTGSRLAAHEHQGSTVVHHVEEVDGGWQDTTQDHHQHGEVLVHSLEQCSPRLGSAPKFQSPAQRRRATQAFAGSKPEGVGIFIATTTSRNVAVLRMLPEMQMSASETRGVVPPGSRRSLTL